MAFSDNEETKEVLHFFVLTFIWSWLFWLPIVFFPVINDDRLIMNILLFLGGIGPAFAAYILSLKNEGISGITRLWKRMLSWKFNKKWYLLMLIILPIAFISYLIAIIFESLVFTNSFLDQPILLPVTFIFLFLLQVVYGEEFGWRGYALDRLFKIKMRRNLLSSSIIVGFVWGLWHIPLFFIPESIQSEVNIIAFLILIILYSIFLSWIYLRSGQSLLAALLIHTMFNFSLQIFPIFDTITGIYFFIIILIFIESVYIQYLWLNERDQSLRAEN